ncbi:MAG: hypothetical protein LQ341_000827 [Variospora aurantia]|nr:MAG: hypothetical protein LQ341_000827 [Variospora aurantia]
MQYLNILVITAISLLQPVLSQTIDPSTVDDQIKATWCNDQQASCPLLCLQQGASDMPAANDCTPSTLAYSCVCSDGQQPNVSEYSQTIPFYECQEAGTQCVNRCENSDPACQTACRTANPCGAQNPTRVNTSTISTMSATTTDGGAAPDATDATAVYTGFGPDSTTATADDSNDAKTLAIRFGKSYGFAMVFISVSVAFTVML